MWCNQQAQEVYVSRVRVCVRVHACVCAGAHVCVSTSTSTSILPRASASRASDAINMVKSSVLTV